MSADEQILRSQQLVDLRSRMLANVQAGREPWVGFTKDELKAGLAGVTAGRARMADAATKGRRAAKKAPAGPPPDMGSLLAGID